MTVRARSASSDGRAIRLFAVLTFAFAIQAASISLLHSDRRPGKDVGRESVEATSLSAAVSVFTVTNGLDAGAGSLRAAVNAANNAPGLSEIRFDLTNTITLLSPLEILEPVSMLGDNPCCVTSTISPVIDAANVGGDVFLFTSAPGSKVEGLRVFNANGYAFWLSNDSFGSVFLTNTVANSKGGIYLDNTSTITITHSLLTGIEEAAIVAEGGSNNWFGLNTIKDFTNVGILLVNGLTNTEVLTNTISGPDDVSGAPIRLSGSPPPTGVVIRGNVYTTTVAPIQMVAGANNDLPPPAVEVFPPLTSTLTLLIASEADPGTYTYPLTIDVYRKSDDSHVPVATGKLNSPADLLQIILDLGLFPPANNTYITAIATTANPSTSPFAPLVEVSVPSLPVELADFSSQVTDDGILLKWSTASETNNAGFEVEQATEGEDFAQLAFIGGNGTTDQPQSYQYLVSSPEPGVHRFRLKQLDFDGTFEYSQTIEAVVTVPGEFFLAPVYPNPFNPTAVVSFASPTEQHVRIDVYDVAGRLVATLFDDAAPANALVRLPFDASELQSGVYLIRAQGVSGVRTRKVTVTK